MKTLEMLESEWKDRLTAAVLAEREAIEQVVDQYGNGQIWTAASAGVVRGVKDGLLAAIRARGEK
jgi:hypothetical protein